MRGFRAFARLMHGLMHAVSGFLIIVFRFPRMTREARNLRVSVWAKRLLEVLGVGLVVNGQPPAAGPMLFVSNHISWLDIPVMHAAQHCRFVSKSDVKDWPLIGTLATGAGTLYIERRERRDAHRMVSEMADSLRAGDILAVFPEGTTGDGREMLPFHANLLQAAIDAKAPIQCVGLRFVDLKGETSFAPSFVGDETLLGSIWSTLSSPGVVARVNFGAIYPTEGMDRRSLARVLHAEINRLRMQ